MNYLTQCLAISSNGGLISDADVAVLGTDEAQIDLTDITLLNNLHGVNYQDRVSPGHCNLTDVTVTWDTLFPGESHFANNYGVYLVDAWIVDIGGLITQNIASGTWDQHERGTGINLEDATSLYLHNTGSPTVNTDTWCGSFSGGTISSFINITYGLNTNTLPGTQSVTIDGAYFLNNDGAVEILGGTNHLVMGCTFEFDAVQSNIAGTQTSLISYIIGGQHPSSTYKLDIVGNTFIGDANEYKYLLLSQCGSRISHIYGNTFENTCSTPVTPSTHALIYAPQGGNWQIHCNTFTVNTHSVGYMWDVGALMTQGSTTRHPLNTFSGCNRTRVTSGFTYYYRLADVGGSLDPETVCGDVDIIQNTNAPNDPVCWKYCCIDRDILLPNATCNDGEEPEQSRLEPTYKKVEFTASPNPATNQVSINWLQEIQGSIRIDVSDPMGQMHKTIVLDIKENQRQINIPLQGYRPGMYMLRVSQETVVLGSLLFQVTE